MSFLGFACGKLIAGKYLRSLQDKLSSVMSRHKRALEDLAEETKQASSQENMAKSIFSSGLNGNICSLAKSYGMPVNGNMFGIISQYQGMASNNQFKQEDMINFSIAQQQASAQWAQAQAVWKNIFDQQSEAKKSYYQSIADSLQTEKESLESQIKLAQADYESMKEGEKSTAGNLKPEYTGQT